MPKDHRLYGNFTLDMPENAKIAILSDAAFRCLIEATLWSRKQERDGWLARRYAVARWSLDVLQELCENDPENPSLIDGLDGFDGYYIHDYDEHQETKADIEARRERNRIAGQKGGLAKANRGAKQPASDSLSESVAEKEEEKEKSTTANAVVDRPRKRGSRLQEGWYPPKDVISDMEAECPHVDFRAEHRKFIDYWIAKTGKDATKLDWSATWRNWIRRAAENTRGHLKVVNGGSGSTVDDKVNGWMDIANGTSGRELE